MRKPRVFPFQGAKALKTLATCLDFVMFTVYDRTYLKRKKKKTCEISPSLCEKDAL